MKGVPWTQFLGGSPSYHRPAYGEITYSGHKVKKLSPEKEIHFRQWYKRTAKSLGLSPDPDDYRHYYDYRGFWESGMEIDPVTYHFSDDFKLPGHPTYPGKKKRWWEK